jgi:hypothetical protein
MLCYLYVYPYGCSPSLYHRGEYAILVKGRVGSQTS